MSSRRKAPKGFPKKAVKILGQNWDVHYVKGLISDEGLYGCTNESKRAILIDADQAAESARDTLLHECIHAILHTSGCVDLTDELEERICRVLTPGIIDLLRSNKKWF